MGVLMRLPRAARYLDENLISTHLWDRLSNAILKASFTSLIQFPPDDDDLEIAAYHLYKFMVRLHPGAFLINPEDQEAVANIAQYFAVHVDQYEIYVFTPPSEGIAHHISAVLRGSLMPPPIAMDSYSRYQNADTEGFWARLHQGTWRLVDGFDAEFCIDSPPVGPPGNLEGQDLVVNVAQGFDMLAEGENRRVLDEYFYGTPVAADCPKHTDDQAVSPGNLEGQDPVVLRGSLMPPPIAMDSYSQYQNADSEGLWARLHRGTWQLVDGFDADFCSDSPPAVPPGDLEGQDPVVNFAQGFDMFAEGENCRVLDEYVYGTPVAAVCQIYTDSQAVSAHIKTIGDMSSLLPRTAANPSGVIPFTAPPQHALFGGTPASDPRGMRTSRQPPGRETRSDGKVISDGRFRENSLSGKKLAAHASNQPAFAKHRITPQDYLDARVY